MDVITGGGGRPPHPAGNNKEASQRKGGARGALIIMMTGGGVRVARVHRERGARAHEGEGRSSVGISNEHLGMP